MSILKPEVVTALQYRIEQEELSNRLYLAISMFLSFKGFAGSAKLFAKYAKEELAHSEKVRDYLLGMDIQPEVPTLEMQSITDTSLPVLIQDAFDHEVTITEQCNALAKLALDNGDMQTFGLAQWFANEQTEELDKMQYWLDRLSAFGTGQIALRELDEEMGELA
jgi:ferritin